MSQLTHCKLDIGGIGLAEADIQRVITTLSAHVYDRLSLKLGTDVRASGIILSAMRDLRARQSRCIDDRYNVAWTDHLWLRCCIHEITGINGSGFHQAVSSEAHVDDGCTG